MRAVRDARAPSRRHERGSRELLDQRRPAEALPGLELLAIDARTPQLAAPTRAGVDHPLAHHGDARDRTSAVGARARGWRRRVGAQAQRDQLDLAPGQSIAVEVLVAPLEFRRRARTFGNADLEALPLVA